MRCASACRGRRRHGPITTPPIRASRCSSCSRISATRCCIGSIGCRRGNSRPSSACWDADPPRTHGAGADDLSQARPRREGWHLGHRLGTRTEASGFRIGSALYVSDARTDDGPDRDGRPHGQSHADERRIPRNLSRVGRRPAGRRCALSGLRSRVGTRTARSCGCSSLATTLPRT